MSFCQVTLFRSGCTRYTMLVNDLANRAARKSEYDSGCAAWDVRERMYSAKGG